MRKIEPTSSFRRDFKREGKGLHRVVSDTDLKQIITDLANDVPLAAKYRDHALTGNWGCKPEPPKILSFQFQPCHKRIQIDHFAVALEGVL